MTGLDIPESTMRKLVEVNIEDWKAEADDMAKFFDSLGPRMPWEIRNELENLKRRLEETP
jgi:phosphoenolpyruvate carboxykinase (GTP)